MKGCHPGMTERQTDGQTDRERPIERATQEDKQTHRQARGGGGVGGNFPPNYVFISILQLTRVTRDGTGAFVALSNAMELHHAPVPHFGVIQEPPSPHPGL